MSQSLRELLFGERQGVLATLSARVEGWPFASVTPYAVTEGGEPLFLFSDLAEHTRNVRRDPRASLLIQDSAALADPQSGGRATLLGSVEAITDTDVAAATQRYLETHPHAADYLSLGDFRLYVLRVSHVRYVGGFGEMGWLDAERFRAALAESSAPRG